MKLPVGFQTIAQTATALGWWLTSKRFCVITFHTAILPLLEAAAKNFPQGEYCTIENGVSIEEQDKVNFSDQSVVFNTKTELSNGYAKHELEVG